MGTHYSLYIYIIFIIYTYYIYNRGSTGNGGVYSPNTLKAEENLINIRYLYHKYGDKYGPIPNHSNPIY